MILSDVDLYGHSLHDCEVFQGRIGLVPSSLPELTLLRWLRASSLLSSSLYSALILLVAEATTVQSCHRQLRLIYLEERQDATFAVLIRSESSTAFSCLFLSLSSVSAVPLPLLGEGAIEDDCLKHLGNGKAEAGGARPPKSSLS